MASAAWQALHLASTLIVRRQIALRVSGLDCLPETGPVIVAARHYHHLYDGCILLATIDRPAHILVGVDWLQHPLGRRIMWAACRAAKWPMIHRPDSPYPGAAADARRLLILAARDTLRLLRAGHVVIIFPEAYPNIDPGLTPKTLPNDFLPFRSGFARFAHMAARTGLRVPIVPAGLTYEQRSPQWNVELRFGDPLTVDPSAHTVDELVQLVEDQVRALSLPDKS